MKPEIILTRSEGRPVAFYGDLIFDVTTRGDDPRKKKSRWHRARGYRTDNGWKLGLARITCWENERDHYWVLDADNPDELFVIISQHVTDQEEADELIDLIESQLPKTIKTETPTATDGEWKPRAKK